MDNINEEIVTLESYYDKLSAEIARTKLEDSGISAMILDGNIIPGFNFFESSEGPIKLKVFKKDLENAFLILNDRSLDFFNDNGL